MKRDALISDCGQFRYSLTRVWDNALPRVVFVMLNPSTADALVDDATIRRCIAFAKVLGFGSLQVVNLFAYRATDPRDLKAAGYPVGEVNDDWIIQACSEADTVVCAWGANARGMTRADEVLQLIRMWAWRSPVALSVTADGIPKHPLYLPGGSKFIVYEN